MTDKAQHQTDRKGVDALQYIHVQKPEQQGLPDVGQPEGQGAAGVAEDQPPEQGFLHNRGKKYRVDDGDQRRAGISGVAHKAVVVLQPYGVQPGNGVHYKGCDILQADGQEEERQDIVEGKSQGTVSLCAAFLPPAPGGKNEDPPVPGDKYKDCQDAVDQVDGLGQEGIRRGGIQDIQDTALFVGMKGCVYEISRN